MKVFNVCRLLIAGVAASINFSVFAAQTEKPIVEQSSLAVVPGSMEAFWDMSEVVARVRIETSRVRGIGTLPLVVTEHQAVVLRVFKGSLKPGSKVVFDQFAGDLELTDKILHVVGAVPLQSQREYVVFLRTWPAAGGYCLVGDPVGAFKIVRGLVEPQGGGPVAEDHRNLPEKRFMEELERMAGRRRELQ